MIAQTKESNRKKVIKQTKAYTPLSSITKLMMHPNKSKLVCQKAYGKQK